MEKRFYAALPSLQPFVMNEDVFKLLVLVLLFVSPAAEKNAGRLGDAEEEAAMAQAALSRTVPLSVEMALVAKLKSAGKAISPDVCESFMRQWGALREVAGMLQGIAATSGQ